MQIQECLSQSGYTDETYNCTLHSFTSDTLSVERCILHEQGNPFLCLKSPQTENSHGVRIACLKVDIQTKPTIARFTHSPLDILSVEADDST